MENLKPLKSLHGEIDIKEGSALRLGYCITCNYNTFSVYEIRLSGLVFRICKKCFAILKGKEEDIVFCNYVDSKCSGISMNIDDKEDGLCKQ